MEVALWTGRQAGRQASSQAGFQPGSPTNACTELTSGRDRRLLQSARSRRWQQHRDKGFGISRGTSGAEDAGAQDGWRCRGGHSAVRTGARRWRIGSRAWQARPLLPGLKRLNCKADAVCLTLENRPIRKTSQANRTENLMAAPRQQLLAAKESLGQGLAPPDTTTERVSVFCTTVSLLQTLATRIETVSVLSLNRIGSWYCFVMDPRSGRLHHVWWPVPAPVCTAPSHLHVICLAPRLPPGQHAFPKRQHVMVCLGIFTQGKGTR